MLPSERRRQEEIAAREAAGESLWSEHFERRALVRIAEVIRVIAAEHDQSRMPALSARVGRHLRAAGGYELTKYQPSDVINADGSELLLDGLTSYHHVIKATLGEGRATFYADIVNAVLRDYRISFKFIEGELISFESDELLQAVVEPALRLMADSRFEAAHDAYLKALKEISNNDPGDAITDAGTALQEALTALGCEGNVLGALIADAKAKGLFKSHDAQLHEAVIIMTKWAASERNKNSDAHRATDATVADAWLMVHVVGAIIVRLSDGSLRGA